MCCVCVVVGACVCACACVRGVGPEGCDRQTLNHKRTSLLFQGIHTLDVRTVATCGRASVWMCVRVGMCRCAFGCVLAGVQVCSAHLSTFVCACPSAGVCVRACVRACVPPPLLTPPPRPNAGGRPCVCACGRLGVGVGLSLILVRGNCEAVVDRSFCLFL